MTSSWSSSADSAANFERAISESSPSLSEIFVLKPAMRRVVSRALGAGLPNICFLMAAFYVFAIGFWLLRDVAGSGRLVLWCVGSFVATLGAGIYWRQNPLTEGAAHRAAYLVTLWGAVGDGAPLGNRPRSVCFRGLCHDRPSAPVSSSPSPSGSSWLAQPRRPSSASRSMPRGGRSTPRPCGSR